jgi:hypothetical protein
MFYYFGSREHCEDLSTFSCFILKLSIGYIWKVIARARGGNRADRVGFGFGSGGSGQFDFLEEIGSGRVRSGSVWVGSIYMLCFFRSLIDFDWIESHLISG